LRLSENLPKKIRKLVREQLGSVHSGWTNWYLETGEYGKARKAVSKAVRMDPNFNILMKWLLTWMVPQLALRAVRHNLERRKDSSGIV
jgi:hypothetical protein